MMSQPNPGLAVSAMILVLGASTTAGCVAEASGRRSIDLDDAELEMAGTTDSGQWQSAPWTDSVWISLGAREQVEIMHGLGREPTGVQVYLSFTDDDRGDSTPRRSFPAAGDVSNLGAITDSSVTVINTTDGEFWMRLVLQ